MDLVQSAIFILALALLARGSGFKTLPVIRRGQIPPFWASLLSSQDYLRMGRWFIPTYSLVLQIPFFAFPHSQFDYSVGVMKYGWRALCLGAVIGYDSEGVRAILGISWKPIGAYKER